MASIDPIIADAETGDDLEIRQRIHEGRVDAGERGDGRARCAHLVGDQGRVGAIDRDTC